MTSNIIELYLCSHVDSHIRAYFHDVSVNNPNVGTLYDDGPDALVLMRGSMRTGAQIFSSCRVTCLT